MRLRLVLKVPDASSSPPLSRVPPIAPSYVAAIPSELRQAVAHLYNHTYRQGKISQYTYENVCIVPGGRAGLSRVAAVVGDVFTVRSEPCVSRFVG